MLFLQNMYVSASMFKYIFYTFIFISTVFPLSLTAKEFTVVLDAGHGGRDYGAVGKTSNEKTINLAVAKKVGQMIADTYDPTDTKVVYTRSTDVFIPLNDRAKIANKAKGDLFISIHVNSVDKRSKNRLSVTGAEVYTLGLHKTEENLAVAKRENSVMALESDFTETYNGFDPNSVESYIIFELSQSRHLNQSISLAVDLEEELTTTASRANKGVKQAGFWVLWATSMPSVLVELDFICNPDAERFISSEAGQQKLAKAIFNAFRKFRESQRPATDKPRFARHAVNGDTTQPADKAIGKESTSTSESNEVPAEEYRIQILASDTPLSTSGRDFKGLEEVSEYTDGGMYKYTHGSFRSQAEAAKRLPDIRKKFPQAFIIKMINGVRVK